METVNKKTDKRVIKTKRAIRQALNEVLDEKAIGDIRVKDIADKALISRNTFYAHYESVDALLDEIDNEVFEQVLEIVGQVDPQSFQFDPFPILNELTKLIYTDYDLYRHLMHSERYNNIFSKLKAVSKKKFLDEVLNTMNVSEDMLALLADFYAAGISAAYQQWFDSDRKIALEDVTKTISLAVSDGVIGLVSRKKGL